MFKRRKTKKAQAAKRAEVKPFDLPPAVNDHPVVMGLPDTSAFRTSLIMRASVPLLVAVVLSET